MRIKSLLMSCCALTSTACSIADANLPKPSTPGERASGHGYIPVDPLPINHSPCDLAKVRPAADFEAWPVLKSLPDFAIRFAVADLKASAGPTFGPVKITAKGQSYRVIMDYINADAVPITFLLTRLEATEAQPDTVMQVAPSREVKIGHRIVGYIVELAPADTPSPETSSIKSATSAPRLREEDNSVERYTFPVYVGVGLRLSADIEARSAGVNLSGLSSIGLAAEAGRVAGTMTVQTLGVNGKSIAIALPLPSKLDQTTIENGILSMGSMRALLYAAASSDTDSVNIQPRVVGIYSPVGSDPRLINSVYSVLARNPPVWVDRCSLKPAAKSEPIAVLPGKGGGKKPAKSTEETPEAQKPQEPMKMADPTSPTISSALQPPPPPPKPE